MPTPITRTVNTQPVWLATLWLLAMITTLSACGRSYSREVRENFINSCTFVGNSPTFCACKLKTIEEHFTEDEFARMERLLTEHRFYDQNLKRVIIKAEQTCPR